MNIEKFIDRSVPSETQIEIRNIEQNEPRKPVTLIVDEFPILSLPRPNNDSLNIAYGCWHRSQRSRDEYSKANLKMFRWITGNLMRNIQPLDCNFVMTLDQYLSKSNYTEERCIELREKYNQLMYGINSKHNFKLEDVPWEGTYIIANLEHCQYSTIFIKNETYPTFKNPRLIWATPDDYKVLFGPIIASIQECYFEQNDDHVKHTTS